MAVPVNRYKLSGLLGDDHEPGPDQGVDQDRRDGDRVINCSRRIYHGRQDSCGRRRRAHDRQSIGRRGFALSAPARPESRPLAALGRSGPGQVARARPAHLPVHRLRVLPLVPRHGGRGLHRRRGRRLSERAFHLDQGRSRGAARPGRGLHGSGAGHDRLRGLAPDRLSDPRSEAVLRRHLLPPRHLPRAHPPGGVGLRESPRRTGAVGRDFDLASGPQPARQERRSAGSRERRRRGGGRLALALSAVVVRWRPPWSGWTIAGAASRDARNSPLRPAGG